MNVAVSLIICAIIFILGLIFALFPRWWMKMVCHNASSYMKEDLASDPLYVMSFRVYGIAAMCLAVYILFQVIEFMAQNP
jgi:uncharacterized membrane protein YedE/YeeE